MNVMNNNDRLETFFKSLDLDNIITILGTASSGKTWLVAFICEYFALKKNDITIFDCESGGKLWLNRLEKIYHEFKNDIDRPSIKIKLDVSYFEDIIDNLKNIKNSIIVIDSLGVLTTRNKDEYLSTIGFGKSKYVNKFYHQLRLIAIENNLKIITIAQSARTAQITTSGNITETMMSDTLAICFRDVKDDSIKFTVSKSRHGITGGIMENINLSSIIKKIIRKEKIENILK